MSIMIEQKKEMKKRAESWSSRREKIKVVETLPLSVEILSKKENDQKNEAGPDNTKREKRERRGDNRRLREKGDDISICMGCRGVGE